MRLAHIADLHLTEQRGDSGESLDEQVQRLVWCGEDAASEGAEIMLCAGDVFDRLSSPAERNAAADVITEWASHMPVVIVYGNHDRPGDLDYLGRLRTEHQVRVFDRPEVHPLEELDVDVVCLPWPRKAWLAARLGAGQDVGEAAVAAMRAILRGFAVEFGKHDCAAKVIIAHAELGGAVMDNGQPLVGAADMPLSAGDFLETGADYIALGHIHKHQVLGERIAYAGSPRQCTFGEDGPKGYYIVDVERSEAPVIEHRQAPGRELITLEGQWIGQDLTPDGADIVDVDIFDWGEYGRDAMPAGSIVRLKYTVAECDRKKAAEQADAKRTALLAAGIHSVKIDARTLTTTRVRSDAIREARTDADRLRAYWESRGETPDRAEAILTKLGELETEVHP